jgi:leader peptidase (prepilin peptidase)/N-methyltransferase
MGLFEIALAFAAGLVAGSFLNVCIYRWVMEISVLKPARSMCPKCQAKVAWQDNIPLLSYVLLRGKCRSCQAPISLRYPLVELSTAAVFAYCAAAFGWTLLAVKLAVFCAIQIALIASDLEERILPDEFTLGGTALGLVFAWFAPVEAYLSFLFAGPETDPRWLSMIDAIVGAVVAGGMVWFIRWAYEKIRHREGMGFGDVKMMMMIGAFLGLRLALGTLFVGCLLGSVLGLLFIYLARKGSDYELPFGSFLGFAAILEALFAI